MARLPRSDDRSSLDPGPQSPLPAPPTRGCRPVRCVPFPSRAPFVSGRLSTVRGHFSLFRFLRPSASRLSAARLLMARGLAERATRNDAKSDAKQGTDDIWEQLLAANVAYNAKSFCHFGRSDILRLRRVYLATLYFYYGASPRRHSAEPGRRRRHFECLFLYLLPLRRPRGPLGGVERRPFLKSNEVQVK